MHKDLFLISLFLRVPPWVLNNITRILSEKLKEDLTTTNSDLRDHGVKTVKKELNNIRKDCQN